MYFWLNRFMHDIEVQNLVKTFREKGKVITAVDGISFNVESGDIFGFLSVSGKGKFLDCLAQTALENQQQ